MSSLFTTYSERLLETLPRVRDQIAKAEEAGGRVSGSVRLIAVTKSHPLECVEAALEAGLEDLGENRVEELEAKVEKFGSNSATWHMIGHLQSRKTRRVLAVADVVHSVDSLKLARKMSATTSEDGSLVKVLAQVNTSGEESKGGFKMESAFEEISQLAEFSGLQVSGLMTMAPFVEDKTLLTNAFVSLRSLSESLVASIDGFGTELSMGMTNDLDIAIREGSTMVRIGTALFGPRPGYAK
jgi:pyridoxal phosphate enzyme (YggS family)